MKTKQEKYKTDIGRLAEKMAEQDTRIMFAVIGAVVWWVIMVTLMITAAGI